MNTSLWFSVRKIIMNRRAKEERLMRMKAGILKFHL